jgi:hypothetical protein
MLQSTGKSLEKEVGFQSQWSAQWLTYDSDSVMHPATDTDKAAVSSVSRNGLALILTLPPRAEGCAGYKATSTADS